MDDELIGRLDQIAKARGTSRSELLRRAIQAVVETEEFAAADAALVNAYRRQPPDPVLIQSAARFARQTTPK